MSSHLALLSNRLPKVFYNFSLSILILILSLTQIPNLLAQEDCVLNADFSSGTNGFTYSDSQNNSQYASGSETTSGNPGGALSLSLGGVDDNSYSNGVENGWETTITGGGSLTISGDFSLFMTRNYEGNEYGDVLVRVNGTPHGLNGNDYLFRLFGNDTDQSSDYTSGWTSFSVTIPGVTAGNHVLKLAAFNNKKTRKNEKLTAYFDNIEVCFTPDTPDTSPPAITISQPTTQTSYEANSNSVSLGGTASDDRSVTSVSWENQTTVQNGSATGTDNWTTPTISLNNGDNLIVMSAFDAAGNSSSDTITVSYNPDLTAPVISNVQVNNITHNSATITWDTDEIANSQVEYSQDTSYDLSSSFNSSLTQSHSVNLVGLSAETIYHFRPLSADGNNNKATSSDFNFTTGASPPDSELPTISLTSPTCDATVAGTVTISADAADNDVVASVEFFVDGNSQDLVTSPPFSFNWNTTGLSEGIHDILLRATDASGNTAEDGCSVTVNNLSPVCVIDANFTGGTEGFSYTDSNNHPQYADGSLRSTGNPGNALALFLAGGDNNSYYDGNENDWQTTVDGGGDITISGDFNLNLTKSMEGDEYGEIRIRLNNTLYGTGGFNYIARLYGSDTDQSSDFTTGWTSFSVTIPDVPNGSHTLKLAAFNNQKTRANEKVSAYFDNIEVCFTPSAPPIPDTTPPVVTITSPTSQSMTTVGNNSVVVGGGASDNRGVSSVSWENQTTGQTGAATGTNSWTTTAISLNNGDNLIVVVAFDAAGNTSSDSITVSYTPDLTAPVISNVQAGNITHNSVTITWDTDEAANTQVEYGHDTSYDSTSNLNNTLTQSHLVNLSNLNAETTYHFRALSADGSNNQAAGTDFNFTTAVLPPDTVPPTVSLTAPACNVTVAGNVTISADASDNESLASVELFVDGNSIGLITSPPYETSWNTPDFSEGVHAILVRATDAAGNTAEDGCDVIVNNLSPVCVINSNFSGGTEGFSYTDSNNHPQYADGSLRSSGNPGNALALFLAGVDDNSYYDGNENSWQTTVEGGGDVTVTGDFNLILTKNLEGDEYGEIRIRLNNTLYGTGGHNYIARLYGNKTDQSSDFTTGWTSFSVTIPDVPNGSHTLKLAAFNNQKTRANEQVTAYFDNVEVCFTPSAAPTPDTTPPAVTITSPTSQRTITVGNNSITLGGTAGDDIGVSSVSWENQTTGQTGSANGTNNWTTPTISLNSGNNSIMVFALDAANNFGGDTLTVNYDSGTDNDPPVISNVQADPLSPSTVTISWNTSEPATSQVEYALNIAINGTIKMMPLGDSITSAFNSYRTTLYGQLDNDGYDIDFVGSRSDGNPNPDPDHEGHGGWLAEAIDANINDWLPLSSPDVILYHIGTNDVTSIFDYDRTIGDISATLDKIWAYNPDTWVILSQIVPRSDNSFFDDRTETLNGFIAQLVQSEQSQGKAISTVDHYSAFKTVSNWETGLLSDGKHPNSNGYDLMADIYYAGLVQVLGDGSSAPVQTPVDNNLVSQHEVTLTGLSENQVYTFSVISADASNNSATSNEGTFQTPSSGNILADFSAGNDGFSFHDSNNHPQYADGSHTNNGHPGGSLRVNLGGVDNNSYYDGNSAGWELTFTAGGDITISGEYNMFVDRNFESSEYGQVGLLFDGVEYGSGGNSYFEQLYGDAVQTQDHVTGWTSFSVTITGQDFQTHTLELNGFNNRKTRANELVQIDFDNIQVTTTGQTLALLNSIRKTTEDLAVLPENQLLGNYPNPFNPTTKIMYNLKEATQVKVQVFNILGQEVTTLFDDWQTRGISTIEWNGRNQVGIQVATGVYILRVKTPGWQASHKLNLVK